ncbi:hypothetical protein [Candidatus Borrarchaeum sp.]|uniref:hypothetical protein n=1 Tax=Candidatus Borrarchaeum sp. TaxID=2846742 RepID=UPI002579C8CF|nr:hypothetical protein [Candidatus Borrarchaeum sp.]
MPEFIDKNKIKDKIVEKHPDSKPIVDDMVRLFENCIKKNFNEINFIPQDESVKTLLYFISRSETYREFLKLWDTSFGKKIDGLTFNKRNFLDIFLPIFLQEIEGPLKRQLSVITFLLGIDEGIKVTWAESTQEFLSNLITKGLAYADNYPAIKTIFEELTAGNQLFRLIRNCIAHSDYFIVVQDMNVWVVFFDRKRKIPPQKFTFERLWNGLDWTLTLIEILHAIVYICIEMIKEIS